MLQRITSCRLAAIVAVTIVAVLGIGGPAAAQGVDDAREVTLELSVDDSGGCRITVVPENAVIWRGANQKLKKVVWVAPPSQDHGELFWELRWDPDKGGGSEDYFGAVDLGCGQSRVKVQPSPKPKIPQAEWPYAVTVFACEGGKKSEQICSVDPRIRWDD